MAEVQELRFVMENVLLAHAEPISSECEKVKGYDWSDETLNYHTLLEAYKTTGFQATNFGRAVAHLNDMVSINFHISFFIVYYMY